MSEPWAFMVTTTRAASCDDPIPEVSWGPSRRNLVVRLSADGVLFIPDAMAEEFARRVQHAVAEKFPPPPADKIPVGLDFALTSPAEAESAREASDER